MPSHLNQSLLANAQAVAQAATAYSSSLDFRGCVGNVALFIASTAGSVTISQQCSLDNVTFYDPEDTSGGALGVVRSALTVTTGKYVPFTPVLATWTRFKIVEGNVAATAVTLKCLFRTEG